MLRRRFFGGLSSVDECLKGFAKGLAVWDSHGIRAHMCALPLADLVADLEGCVEITVPMLLNLCEYDGSAKPEDIRMFEEAIERGSQDAPPRLELPKLLQFITSMPTLNSDCSLRKSPKGNTKIKVYFQPFSEKFPLPHVSACFYKISLPQFPSTDELIDALVKVQRHCGFDRGERVLAE